MSTKFLLLGLYSLLTLSFVFSPQFVQPAHAACGQDSVLGIPTWHKYLEDEVVADKCTPLIRSETPEESVDLILSIAVVVIEIAATLGAVVALVMVLWGSFNFVTSLGEPDKAASARKTVQNAAIGLVILLLSTRVISFFGGFIV